MEEKESESLKPLTDKQRMFCEYYIVDLNATDAARKAGYSKKTADVIGCENLVKPNIQAYIKAVMEERSKKVGVDAEEILSHLNILRKARIDEYVILESIPHTEEVEVVIPSEDPDGEPSFKLESVTTYTPNIRFKDFKDLTEEQLMCIESVKMGTKGIELKLHGKEWAIDKINRHVGFYAEDNFQKVSELNQVDREKRIEELYSKLPEK